MCTEAHRHAISDNLKYTSERVAIRLRFVDEFDHIFLAQYVGAVERRIGGNGTDLLPRSP